jgi:type II secretory pathway predicted ATPase ExeA
MDPYTEYFGLSAAPFGRGVPVNELLTGGQWDEMAARLLHVARNKAFGVFTGETGTGKTTALRRLAIELDPMRYRVLYVCDSFLTPRNFYVEALRQLGYSPSGRFYRGDAKRRLAAALADTETAGMSPVMIVDEGHLLSNEMLEEIRFLLNFDMDSRSACALILTGQNELKAKLRLHIHQAIEGRIDMRFQLLPMERVETRRYITRHMERVQCPRAVFTDAAVAAIHDWSGGIPRKVNKLAEGSLMAATSQQKELVDDYLVKEVIESEFEI